jgi:hypothetical protein
MVDRFPEKRLRQAVPKSIAGLFSLLILVCGIQAKAAPPAASHLGPVSFEKQIKPILHARCQGCHQPASAGGQLVLTGYAGLAKGGEHGAVFTAGKPEASPLLDYLTGPRCDAAGGAAFA